MQVAIDGPAGAGKSTVGRALARELGCQYLDTGLMYRAVTHLALDNQIPLDHESQLGQLAGRTIFGLDSRAQGTLIVNGKPAGSELRTASVDAAVSTVAAHPAVRAQLVRSQRQMASNICIVMVGRDIGTTVLPHASLKLWVTASPEERARRRLNEGLHGPASLDREEIAARLHARDALDSQRQASPLQQANDAVVINTDALTTNEALTAALQAVDSRLAELESL